MTVRRAVCACALLVSSAWCAASCGARTGLAYPGSWGECTSREPVAPAPIEIHVVMDTSHSMDFLTANGVTKWDAVRTALGAFLVDPASAGVAVALTFFPQGTEDDPGADLCADVTTCPDPAAVCAPFFACFPSGSTGCNYPIDCAADGEPGDTCHPFGICEDGATICAADDPAACGGAGGCVSQGYCAGGAVCEPDLYAIPNVPLAVLPDAATPLLSALTAKATGAGTPTLPALRAVIDGAIERAAAQPTHAVLVLLTTDGYPNECDPAAYAGDLDGAVAHLASVAASGEAARVRTFVLAVVTPEEQSTAQHNLDLVASAGGTGHAYLVTTDHVVEDSFLAALRAIEAAGASCEQTVPEEPDGRERDLSRLRVRLVHDDGAEVLTRRAGADDCEGGGYYLVEASGKPARIVLCTATCNDAVGGEIELTYPCDYEPPGTL